MDRAKLIKFLERRKACKPALTWLAKQKKIGPELLGQCPDLDWLEWLLERTDSRSWNRYLGKVKPLLDEYHAKENLVWDEYDATIRPTWSEREAKARTIWDEDNANANQILDEYHARVSLVLGEYRAKLKPLLDEYEAKARPILLEVLTWDAIEEAAK